MFLYRDRQDAGSDLAQLIMMAEIYDPLLLAIPRGGVPVASVISRELAYPFDVLIIRKIFYPGKKKFIIGAMTEDERAFITEDINYADPRILEVINEERHELQREVALYRWGRGLVEFKGRNVILIDDSLSDGISVLAASRYLKQKAASKVVLAVPVAPLNEGPVLKRYLDQVLCPHRVPLVAPAGQWYQEFSALSDQDVLEFLGRDHFTESPTLSI